MAKRNLFTTEEIIMCTYIARFGRNGLEEERISRFKNRSLASIKMKVQNIAYMLDEEGFPTSNEVSKLSGTPPGKTGRRTNYDVVIRYTSESRTDLLNICREFLK